MEVADAIGQQMGRSWTPGDGKEQISDKVRRQWKQLEKLMDQKREGLFQQAADQGFSYIAWPERDEGGGTGKMTRYLLRERQVSINVDETESTLGASVHTSSADEIRYICEDLDDAGPIVRHFYRGYKMNGWRRWMFVAVILIAAIEAAFLVIVVTASLSGKAGVMGFINILFAAAVSLWGTWKVIGPIVTLPDRRINLAPWWMQSENDDRLIEWRCPPKHSMKAIKAARYTSACPLCNGKISVKNGGREFHGRLVGRCAEAPSEHIFSFDHVLRRGKLQR
ncbi:MAG: hypothetical protein WBJ68_15190 [Candidatus Dechloromonas phosphoritropha]